MLRRGCNERWNMVKIPSHSTLSPVRRDSWNLKPTCSTTKTTDRADLQLIWDVQIMIKEATCFTFVEIILMSLPACYQWNYSVNAGFWEMMGWSGSYKNVQFFVPSLIAVMKATGKYIITVYTDVLPRGCNERCATFLSQRKMPAIMFIKEWQLWKKALLLLAAC
jgi:hypothetical protein